MLLRAFIDIKRVISIMSSQSSRLGGHGQSILRNLPVNVAVNTVILALFLGTMLLLGGAPFSFRLVASVFGVGFVISLTGDRFLVWLQAPVTSARCAMTIVIGTALTSLFVVPIEFLL